MALSVFVADGHAIVREGICTIPEGTPNFTVIGEAGDGLTAVRLVERLAPDLMVLAIMMPGLNGLDALPIIRQRSPRTRVVVLSAYDTVAYVAQALRRGALGYVFKSANASAIIDALREVAAGRRYLSPPVSEEAVDDYLANLSAADEDPHEMLTPREREVLQLAAEGHTCPQIGVSLSISERTVEKHRANLMHKLGLRTQTDLVLYALRRRILPADGAGTRPGQRP
jgi:two-component system, NarL family, response regulator NreC